jgi:hypothetical protein
VKGGKGEEKEGIEYRISVDDAVFYATMVGFEFRLLFGDETKDE